MQEIWLENFRIRMIVHLTMKIASTLTEPMFLKH